MDLTELISTIITSTAAIVAIIGGFLVSRVISISSEQKVRLNVLQDIRNKIQKSDTEMKLFGSNYEPDSDVAKYMVLENEYLKKLENEQLIILNNTRPSGVLSGMLVLFYACVVGIAYPISLLPYPLDTYNDIVTKWFLLCLFYSELLAIFVYLFLNLQILTRKL